jgi:hypothetical protein
VGRAIRLREFWSKNRVFFAFEHRRSFLSHREMLLLGEVFTFGSCRLKMKKKLGKLIQVKVPVR